MFVERLPGKTGSSNNKNDHLVGTSWITVCLHFELSEYQVFLIRQQNGLKKAQERSEAKSVKQSLASKIEI